MDGEGSFGDVLPRHRARNARSCHIRYSRNKEKTIKTSNIIRLSREI